MNIQLPCDHDHDGLMKCKLIKISVYIFNISCQFIFDKQNKRKVETKQQKMYIIAIDYTILKQLLNDKTYINKIFFHKTDVFETFF